MPKTVLVADDSDMIRKLLCRLFETEEDYELCAEAKNGEEAISLAVIHKPDLIIMDVSMPVMDGRATIYALLKINPKAKIIAMSGMDEAESVAKASTAGIKYFISKPYTAATLLKTLRTIAEG